MVAPRRRDRASRLGSKRRRSATSQTRRRVSALTSGLPASAREAVEGEPRASAATSASVGAALRRGDTARTGPPRRPTFQSLPSCGLIVRDRYSTLTNDCNDRRFAPPPAIRCGGAGGHPERCPPAHLPF